MSEYSPEFRNLLGAITQQVKKDKPEEYPEFYEIYPNCNALRVEEGILLLCGVYVEEPRSVEIYLSEKDRVEKPTIGYANFSKAGYGDDSNVEHWLTMDGKVLRKVIGDPVGPSEFLSEDEVIKLTRRLIKGE